MPSPRWCITIGDQSRILTRHGRNPGAFRSFVMACPVVYERQVLRLGPVNQSVGWQPWWRGKAGGAGSGARGLVSRSRLSQITSCHLGSAGLAPTLSGENTRVNILSFQAPQKIFPGPSPRPAQSHRSDPSLALSPGLSHDIRLPRIPARATLTRNTRCTIRGEERAALTEN